jgi:DNA polymerase sigma
VLCVLIVSFLQASLPSFPIPPTPPNGLVSQMRSKAAVSYSRSGHTSGVSWNLGSLLLDFFHLYGSSFNYQELGISIREGGSYFHKTDRVWANPGRQSILCIENPDQPDIDMGKNSFLMFKVKKAFEHGHQVLLVALLKCNQLNDRRKRLSSSGAAASGVGGVDNGSSDDDGSSGARAPSASETSILAHLIRSDDEMLVHRLEEKKELLREWEAVQKRKERHGPGQGAETTAREKRKKARIEREGSQD